MGVAKLTCTLITVQTARSQTINLARRKTCEKFNKIITSIFRMSHQSQS